MDRKNIFITVITAFLVFSSSFIYASENAANRFEELFSQWTAAFNNKDLTKSCALFSKNVVADYRGLPQKNYSLICDGFKKVFSEQNQRYHYRFKIHHVYASADLAAVRITWYLSVYEGSRLISSVQDEGLDVLQRGKNGEWVIVNYLGYST